MLLPLPSREEELEHPRSGRHRRPSTPPMTTARPGAGGPLGLTNSKGGLRKSGGKRAQKISQAVRAIEATHDTPAPARTYTDAELQRAAGRPALDPNDAKYDALWAEACRTMDIEPSTL